MSSAMTPTTVWRSGCIYVCNIESIDQICTTRQSNKLRLIHVFCCRYVYIALEALDELLITCRDTTLNLYVESFLRIVLLLLETDNSDLQMRAVQSV